GAEYVYLAARIILRRDRLIAGPVHLDGSVGAVTIGDEVLTGTADEEVGVLLPLAGQVIAAEHDAVRFRMGRRGDLREARGDLVLAALPPFRIVEDRGGPHRGPEAAIGGDEDDIGRG